MSIQVAAGATAGFSVTATGVAPLAYQWYHNGSLVSGATSNSISVVNAQVANAGNYSVLVSNADGAVVSAVAVLSVVSAPTFQGVVGSTGLIVDQGESASLTFSVTGSPAPTYQWTKDGASLAGATSATLTITNAAPSDAGVYVVTATNTQGSASSGEIEVTVAEIGAGSGPLAITTARGTQVSGAVDGATGELSGGVTAGGPLASVAPKIGRIAGRSDLFLEQGETVTLNVSATGIPSPTFQWHKDGVALGGQTGGELTLTNVQPGDAGSYTVKVTNTQGMVTGAAILVTVASISDTGGLAITGGDGRQINGSFDPATGVLSGGVTNGGSTAVVAPRLGAVTSKSPLLLELGQSTALKASAIGSPAPTYQWFKDEVALVGETRSSLLLASATTATAGEYVVKATNTGGTVTSESIGVTVTSKLSGTGALSVATSGGTRIEGDIDPTTGVLQAGVTIGAGGAATIAPAIASLTSAGGLFLDQGATAALRVAATGNPAPSFQWKRNGVNLPGQTSATLSLVNAQPNDAGTYTVTATNGGGVVTSDGILVTVANISGTGQLAIAGGDGRQVNAAFDPATGVLSGGVTNGGSTAIVAPRLGVITSRAPLLLEIGSGTVLKVAATGNPAPVYQWFKDGLALAGETTASLTLSSVTNGAAGEYWATASNAGGTVTSEKVGITVTSRLEGDGPLTVATSGGTRIEGEIDQASGVLQAGVTVGANGSAPVAPSVASVAAEGGVFLNQGDSTSLTVGVTGNPVPQLQWRRNGVNIPGATSRELFINNAQPGDAGAYTVVATNSGGTLTTDAMHVTVASIGSGGSLAISGGDGTQINATYDPASGALSGGITAGGAGGVVAPRFGSISSTPSSLLAERGSIAVLRVAGNGNPAPSFQWYLNDEPLAGQTSPMLTLSPVRDSDAGIYTVRLRNSLGTKTSETFALTVAEIGDDGTISVSSASGSQLNALFDETSGVLRGSVSELSTTTAPTISGVATSPNSLLVDLGETAILSALASGYPLPSYQWFHNGLAVEGANGSELVLPSISGRDAGEYTVLVTNAGGSVASGSTLVTVIGLAEDGSVTLATGGGTQIDGGVNPSTGLVNGDVVTVPTSPAGPGDVVYDPFAKLNNVSTRTFSGAGDDVVVAGFVIGGSGRRQLLVRGVGPGLRVFGVTDANPAPFLQLFKGSQLIATNAGWTKASNSVEIVQIGERVGAFPLGVDGGDAALVASLEAGAYTVAMSGEGGANGESLLEVYDASANENTLSRLVNFSSKQRIAVPGEALSFGFVVSGTRAKRLLVRAVGPTLATFGLADVLPNPVLKVSRGGTVVSANTNWQAEGRGAEIAAASATVGAFGLSSAAADSALIGAFEPGSYAVEIMDAQGGTGAILVEVYELP